MFLSLAGIFRSLILPVTWGLLHFLWQGALVALVLGALLLLLRRGRPQVRYVLSCAALLIMAVLPVVTALRHAGPPPEEAAAILSGRPGDAGLLPASGEPEPGEFGDRPGSGLGDVSGGGIGGEVTGEEQTAGGSEFLRLPWLVRTRLFTLLPGPDSFVVIFTLWFIGVLLFGLSHFVGWRRVHRLTTHGTSPLPDTWEMVVRELKAHFHNARRVRILQSALARVPAVIGWLRPIVLVPAGLITGMDPEHLRIIMAHELAHVQRFDYLVNLLQVGAETVLFYHPAVWWVSRRIRRERELCCDDLAVALCGDRLFYARALLNLEELRPLSGLAPAATGGSLTERIHRLLGGDPMFTTHRTRPYLAGLMLTSVLVLGCSVMALEADAADRRADDPATQATAVPPVPVPPAGLPAVSGSSEAAVPAPPTEPPAAPAVASVFRQGDQEQWQGRWEIHTGENGLHLQLRYGPGGEREGGWGTQVEESRFTGLEYSDRDEFELRAEAGTISFTGTFTRTQWGHEGAGTYTFRPNRDFPRSLERLGIGDVRDRHLLGYTLAGITAARVRDVQELGYRDLDADDVMEIGLFDVSPEFIRELRQLGYTDLPFRRLVEFRIHGATPAFIREIGDLGFRGLSATRLIEFRIHGVTPEYIRAMSDQGFELDEQGLVEFRIHGVSPEFMREMAEMGYRNLSASQLVEFRIHGVSPEYVRAMQQSGYTDLSPSRLVEYRIHGVSPEYVREMERSGFEHADRDDLVTFRIHGVTPEFVSAMAELGYADLSADQLLEFRIHGVTPDFVRAMRQNGYTDLPPAQLVEFRIHGVTPELVNGLRQAGFRDIPARRLVEARIYGVTLDYIRYVREDRGLSELTLEEIIKLKKYNIIKP